MKQALLFAIALCLGLSIAYVDSSRGWDDTGITVFALLVASGMLGFLSPRRPWLWALVVGIWIPLVGIITRQDYTMLLVLLVPLAGAYAGMATRLLIRKARTSL